jgi:hypothetical protein
MYETTAPDGRGTRSIDPLAVLGSPFELMAAHTWRRVVKHAQRLRLHRPPIYPLC